MTKRKKHNAQDVDQDQPNKRPRSKDTTRNDYSSPRQSKKSTLSSSSSSNQPRQDPTYGQRGAFPGLDGDNTTGKPILKGTEQDDLGVAAMAYLRDVRYANSRKASQVPSYARLICYLIKKREVSV